MAVNYEAWSEAATHCHKNNQCCITCPLQKIFPKLESISVDECQVPTWVKTTLAKPPRQTFDSFAHKRDVTLAIVLASPGLHREEYNRRLRSEAANTLDDLVRMGLLEEFESSMEVRVNPTTVRKQRIVCYRPVNSLLDGAAIPDN